MQSEHLFHQLLTSKQSCYENATKREGDVFGIQLVAAAEPPSRPLGGSGPGPRGPPPGRPKPQPPNQPGTSRTPTSAEQSQVENMTTGEWEYYDTDDYIEQVQLGATLETANDFFNRQLIESQEKALISATKKTNKLENALKTLFEKGVISRDQVAKSGAAADLTAILEVLEYDQSEYDDASDLGTSGDECEDDVKKKDPHRRISRRNRK